MKRLIMGCGDGDTSQQNIFNEDCVTGARRHLADRSIDLGIYDPPFNIGESKFGRHYNRNEKNVLPGYVEAPSDMTYYDWTVQWLTEAVRVQRDDGPMYVISGWSNLRDVLNAVEALKLVTINHLIWKFNFGVYTARKFVSSHYHILYLRKPHAKRVRFNQNCRFSPDARGEDGRSLQYADREDVWFIRKQYSRGQTKNCNKLPDELVRKMIQFSSAPGDTVCDFFLGNFTTAFMARELGRQVVGFELNPQAYAAGIRRLRGEPPQLREPDLRPQIRPEASRAPAMASSILGCLSSSQKM